MIHHTKQRLLDVGLEMLLERGYNDLGIQALLDVTHTPKGSFYHHFRDKEDFALQVVDQYIVAVHAGLDECLHDKSRPALSRIRHFFELTQQKYKEQGYLGCLLGGLGQELSGVNDAFRQKVEECLSGIADRIALCPDEAKANGEIEPDCEVRHMASLLVDCWEGAALRSRLRSSAAPLAAMLDFYFASIANRTTECRRAVPGPADGDDAVSFDLGGFV